MQKKQQTSWCNLFRFMYLGTTPNSPNVQNGPFPASYFFILSFQQLAVNMFITKFCQWLHSNQRSLVLEVAALATEPHPLP